MKLTKTKLKRIILEELKVVLSEAAAKNWKVPSRYAKYGVGVACNVNPVTKECYTDINKKFWWVNTANGEPADAPKVKVDGKLVKVSAILGYYNCNPADKKARRTNGI